MFNLLFKTDTEARVVAEELGVPVEVIYDGRDRLKRHRHAVMRELGFESLREMFAAGVPTK